MTKDTEHGRILARAAGAALTPLGCRRKGRSRVWIADQISWVIIIEFQPSGFERGSYLNVAPMWLWYEKDSWSFDFGDIRVSNFVQYRNTEQFERAANELATQAAREVTRFRELLSSGAQIAKRLVEAANEGSIWQQYHAAVAAGLVGNVSSSLELFAGVLKFPSDTVWVSRLQNECAELAQKLQRGTAFHDAVHSIIRRSRALHRLPDEADCLVGW